MFEKQKKKKKFKEMNKNPKQAKNTNVSIEFSPVGNSNIRSGLYRSL